jgi:Esterase/lipase
MPLDPQVRVLLEQIKKFQAQPLSSLEPAVARQSMQMLANFTKPAEPVASVKDITIPGPNGTIPIRIYTPFGSGPFPLFIFFHGGGWVLGDLDSYDDLCYQLTNKAGAIVISVAYRLAPEHKFPEAPQDCYAATQWIAEHAHKYNGDPARIAIGGDSAGGNLTAVVTQMARAQQGPHLIFQLLIYPATDMTAATASLSENAEGYFLTRDDLYWFTRHYIRTEEDKRDPLASPYLAADLHGLPPALIITGEYDPLRDEGELYGQRLQEAGVPVTIHRYPGMIHGFISLPSFLQQGRNAIQECGEALHKAFTSSNL